MDAVGYISEFSNSLFRVLEEDYVHWETVNVKALYSVIHHPSIHLLLCFLTALTTVIGGSYASYTNLVVSPSNLDTIYECGQTKCSMSSENEVLKYFV